MRMHVLVCVPVCATCVPLVCVCVRERGVSAPANTLVSGTFASATLAAHALRPVHELPGSASLRPATEPWGWAPRAADGRCGDASQGPEKMPVPHLSSRPPQSRASSLPRGEMSRRRHRALLSSGTGQWSSPDPPAVTAETRPGRGSRHLRPAELLWGQEARSTEVRGTGRRGPVFTAPGAHGAETRGSSWKAGAGCGAHVWGSLLVPCPGPGAGVSLPRRAREGGANPSPDLTQRERPLARVTAHGPSHTGQGDLH